MLCDPEVALRSAIAQGPPEFSRASAKDRRASCKIALDPWLQHNQFGIKFPGQTRDPLERLILGGEEIENLLEFRISGAFTEKIEYRVCLEGSLGAQILQANTKRLSPRADTA